MRESVNEQNGLIFLCKNIICLCISLICVLCVLFMVDFVGYYSAFYCLIGLFFFDDYRLLLYIC